MSNYCCLKFDIWRLKIKKNCKMYWKAEKNVLVILASDFEDPKEYNFPSDLRNSQYSLLRLHCLKAFPSAESLFRVHIKCSRRIWTSSFFIPTKWYMNTKVLKNKQIIWLLLTLYFPFFLSFLLPSYRLKMSAWPLNGSCRINL